MRCPSCNKFVSFDDPEAKVIDERIEDGEYCVEVRVVLNCVECGTELKETTMEFDADIQHDCPDEEVPDESGDHALEVDTEADLDPYERYEKKHKYYGVEVTGHIHCPKCESTFDIQTKMETVASDFEEV